VLYPVTVIPSAFWQRRKKRIQILPHPQHRRADHRVADEQAGHPQEGAVAHAGQGGYQR